MAECAGRIANRGLADWIVRSLICLFDIFTMVEVLQPGGMWPNVVLRLAGVWLAQKLAEVAV